MGKLKGRRPSPALLVAVVALVAALGGGAVAGVAVTSLNKKEKKQVKKIAKKEANKQISKKAPKLSVASADFASTAQTADTATKAENAQTATTANSADSLNDVSLQAATSPSNSTQERVVARACPVGMRVLGTGASIIGGGSGVAITEIKTNTSRTGVVVVANEVGGGTTENWSVEAQAICGPS